MYTQDVRSVCSTRHGCSEAACKSRYTGTAMSVFHPSWAALKRRPCSSGPVQSPACNSSFAFVSVPVVPQRKTGSELSERLPESYVCGPLFPRRA